MYPIRLFALLSGLISLVFSVYGSAASHGILVGVSDYPFLDEQLNLVGPRNDVLLMYDVLQQKGIPADNLHLLTERHPKAIAPTRSNILGILKQVLEQSASGDFVYLHFSGHGSQQPASRDQDEIDGMDEIFLPADTKHWRPSSSTVENAITDDEISTWLDRFQEKNVFVWLVFDSCHSGTMSRSQWQSRKVPATLLGVPARRSTRTDTTAPVSTGVKSQGQGGGYVAFFAAQTNEETPEMELPKHTESPQRYGLFTYHLIQSITQYPDATYRQIAEKIIQNYSSQLWFGSRPLFVGDQLDAPVFSARANGEAPGQWRINKHAEGYEIPAGELLGLGEGSRFAVLPSPTATMDDAIGFAESISVEPLTSQLSFIAHKHGSQQFPLLTRVPESAFARLVESRLDTSLSVSIMDTGDVSSATFNKVIKQLKSEGIPPIQLIWREGSQPADVRLLADKNEIVLLTDGEPLPCKAAGCEQRNYHKVPISEANSTAESLASSLRTIAKAKGLLKLGTVIGGDALDVTLNVTRKQGGAKEAYDGSSIPTLYTGDQLSLTIANFIEQPLDITVLFVSSDFGIAVAFPRGNQFNRFMEEEEKTIPLGTINAKTIGSERIIVIATQASRSASMANFGFLAQEGLKARNNPDPITALISEAGFGNNIKPRGDMPVSTSVRKQADIKTISWVTAKE